MERQGKPSGASRTDPDGEEPPRETTQGDDGEQGGRAPRAHPPVALNVHLVLALHLQPPHRRLCLHHPRRVLALQLLAPSQQRLLRGQDAPLAALRRSQRLRPTSLDG
jgi:hypothetical protein